MAELEKTREVKRQEMDQSITTERTKPGALYIPNVDICEGRESLVLYVDVPGAGEGDIKVTLENDILTIEASVVQEKRDDHKLAYAEYGIGDFFRSFTITEAVDRDKIEARLKDGVLRITLPKAEAAKPKQIRIQAE